jgi:hypothetical protein
MTFTARQVLTAAQLNDLSIDTLTTSGTVTIGGFSLPAVDGSADQVLVTNGSGTVTWQDQSGGGGTPGGSDGQVQYNNGGAFGGASGLYYQDSTGNVGIGTTTPSVALHVNGEDGVNIPMYVTSTDTVAGIALSDGDSTSATKVIIAAVGDDMRLNAGGAERMRIDSNGNVGIGTASPSVALDVAGQINADGFITIGASSTTEGGEIRLDGGTSYSANYARIDRYGNNLLRFMDQSAVRMSLDITNGNLTLNGDLTGTSNTNFFVGNDSNERILFQESSNQLFFMTNNTYRAYFTSVGHFVPYADSSYTLGTSSLRWGYLYADSVNCATLIDVNWVRNTNGNFLALEGGDGWDLGNNASGEYVWVAAESGLMIVSSDANSTSWANRNQIRITPEGGINERLRIHGGLEVEGPDGGMVMRYWQANSAYGMIGTANMGSNEYALLTDGVNTFISGGAGGSVHLRGGNNDATPQLVVSNSAITCDNADLTIDLSISQNGTGGVNNFYAESKFRYVSTSNDWSAQPVQEISSQDIGYATRSLDSDTHTGQLRAASTTWYLRNHNDGSYWYCAAIISNQSSRRMKQDIETWGHMKPLSSAVNADYDTTATDLVRQLRPVSFRFNKQDHLPRDLPGERRQEALDRLNRIRLARGEKMFDSEEAIHECGRDCDHSVEDPCVLYQQWNRGTIGFIAEEVGEVIPEATDIDVRPRSPTQGQNTAIDGLALTAILTKAMQEIDARLSALESAA